MSAPQLNSNNKRPLIRKAPNNATTAITKLTKPFRSPVIKSSSASSAPKVTTASTNLPDTSLHSRAQIHQVPAPAPSDDTESLEHLDNDELYKKYLDLSRQLTQMRQSLDTAQQALNILKTGQQQSIHGLIGKWTAVVHETAEELFEDVKTRVDTGRLTYSSTRERSSPECGGRSALTEEQLEMQQAQQEEDHEQALKYELVQSIEEDSHDDHTTPVSAEDIYSTGPTDTPIVLHYGHNASPNGCRLRPGRI